MKPIKLVIKIFVIAVLVGTLSCETGEEWGTYRTNPIELRQLVKTTETKQNFNAGFFLIMGGVSSSTTQELSIKVLAKIDNSYVFLDMPMNIIRIYIDNSLTRPNIQLEYRGEKGQSVDYILHHHFVNYIINCPEQYLPEKFIPIEL